MAVPFWARLHKAHAARFSDLNSSIHATLRLCTSSPAPESTLSSSWTASPSPPHSRALHLRRARFLNFQLSSLLTPTFNLLWCIDNGNAQRYDRSAKLIRRCNKP
ncbi:hypothetical protein ACQY0O_001621 [Thecaphora frezii]